MSPSDWNAPLIKVCSAVRNRLMLGTAGLGGQPYGLHGTAVDFDVADEIIRTAYEEGIRDFDTAPSYGLAELWLGACLSDKKDCNVYTKNNGDTVAMMKSLRLFAPHRPLFMYHNWENRTNLGTCGLEKWHTGYTTYTDTVFSHQWHQWQVQAPWNILNQYHRGPIIARSVFLRGRLTSTYDYDLGSALGLAIEQAWQFAEALGVTIEQLALRAALEAPNIMAVLIGPTTVEELRACLAIADMAQLRVNHLIPVLDVQDRKLTDPRTWN